MIAIPKGITDFYLHQSLVELLRQCSSWKHLKVQPFVCRPVKGKPYTSALRISFVQPLGQQKAMKTLQNIRIFGALIFMFQSSRISIVPILQIQLLQCLINYLSQFAIYQVY
jgi:hypothetical protein